MENSDRIVRILTAALIAVLYFTEILSGTWVLILGVLALGFIVTSFMSFCPLY